MADATFLPLLKLPPELRNRIFAAAVIEDVPLAAYITQHPKPQAASPDSRAKTTRTYETHPGVPALALVDHQIRNKVLPVFYGQNIFYFNISGMMMTNISTGQHFRGGSLRIISATLPSSSL